MTLDLKVGYNMKCESIHHAHPVDFNISIDDSALGMFM